MSFIIPLLFLALLPFPAFAGMAEAKDLAKQNGCKPIAFELVGKETGADESATYKATCEMVSIASDAEKKANGTLIIRCTGTLCFVLKKGE